MCERVSKVTARPEPSTHRTLATLFTYTKLNTLASYPNRGA